MALDLPLSDAAAAAAASEADEITFASAESRPAGQRWEDVRTGADEELPILILITNLSSISTFI